MTTPKQEIENTNYMTEKLLTDLSDICEERKENFKEVDFKGLENDIAEMRSKGICYHDETATMLIEKTIKSADINWECLIENLDEHTKKEILYHLK